MVAHQVTTHACIRAKRSSLLLNTIGCKFTSNHVPMMYPFANTNKSVVVAFQHKPFQSFAPPSTAINGVIFDSQYNRDVSIEDFSKDRDITKYNFVVVKRENCFGVPIDSINSWMIRFKMINGIPILQRRMQCEIEDINGNTGSSYDWCDDPEFARDPNNRMFAFIIGYDRDQDRNDDPMMLDGQEDRIQIKCITITEFLNSTRKCKGVSPSTRVYVFACIH